MQDPLRSHSLLGGLAFAGLSASLFVAQQAVACPDLSVKQAEVPLDLGGGAVATISVRLFDYEDLGVTEADRPEDDCHAWLQTGLSAFPSIESRYTTGRVADAIAETVTEWEVGSCSVAVYYQNDVGAEFAEHELCRNGRYGFADARAHSLSSEAYCWDPEAIEVVESIDEGGSDPDGAFEDEDGFETELVEADVEFDAE